MLLFDCSGGGGDCFLLLLLLLLLDNPQNVYTFLSATIRFPQFLLNALFNLTFPSSIFLFCYLLFMLALALVPLLVIIFFCLIVVRLFLFLCTAKNFSIDIALKEVTKVIHVHTKKHIHAQLTSCRKFIRHKNRKNQL